MAASTSGRLARPMGHARGRVAFRVVCSVLTRRGLLAATAAPLLLRPGAGRARVIEPPPSRSPFGRPGVITFSNPSPEFLEQEVQKWETWMCPEAKFPYHFDHDEDCLFTAGRVVVTPVGGRPVEIKAGDFVTFPEGMDCTWDIKEGVMKYYKEYTRWEDTYEDWEAQVVPPPDNV